MVTDLSVHQNRGMTDSHGWISYTGDGDNSHLSAEQSEMVEEKVRERRELRGALLAIVQIRVFENGEAPQVSFPPEASLGPDSDQSVIADVVNRARECLADWR
jgi:hypothetical protein